MDIHVELWKKLAEHPDFELSTYLNKFMSLSSNLDQINFVYDELEKHSAFPQFHKDGKNDITSIAVRHEGNKLYKKNLFSNAFNCYTVSILAAKTKEVLALAYANRSAALLKMGLYKESLTDIGRALVNGYPNKAKLTARQDYCNMFKKPILPAYEKVPKIRNVERHPFIQSAKNCVEIRRNERFGRHVVATRDIKIGEVVVIEQPFAFKLLDQELVYCHECLELCYCNIPCDHCTRSLYCSTTCKDKAFSDYHKYECPLLHSIKGIPGSNESVLLPLKLIFQNGQKFFTEVPPSPGVYRSDRLREIRDLQTHLDTTDPFTVFEKCALVAGIVHLVKNHSSFLESAFSEEHLKENLFKVMLICELNSVEITEFTPKDNTDIFEKQQIGAGLYSFCSLFNHSCCNNVAKNFHGNTIVLRAVNSIKKGEQCFVNYSSNYLVDLKPFRQGYLTQHKFFTCTCRACEEDWPIFTPIDFQANIALHSCDCFNLLLPVVVITGGANVAYVKEKLKLFISEMQKKEKKLPPSRNYSLTKYALLQCYNVLGNKRRV
ncbi:hypothetical protein Zmor_023091 [Zophobas morio]|uniref:SET and MYND domain-containing protein 4 n=1 Tax=Zophobas morio TaxID=2755281 RepID=A0AA38HWG3_9CUCU|nr:hypothetical protein Zmor_023091 [Zophobas morio]